MPETIQLITRRAPLTPSSYDAETRTIEAVISTGAPVKRRDYKGTFTERLDLSRVSLRPLAGIPVLDAHSQWSARDVVGVVESVRREKDGLVAKIKLSGADDAKSIVQKVAEGSLRSVSIGYHAATQTETTKDGERTITIVPSIREVSVVPIGADSGAKLRSNEMEDDVIEDAPAPMPEAQQQQIRSIGELADLQPSVVEDMIARNLSVEDARNEIRAAFTQRSQQTPRIRVVSPPSEDPEVQRAARIDALYVRAAGGTPSEHARPYMQDRLIDVARGSLERSGISAKTLNPDEIFTRAMGTSDFPMLLTGVGNRSLIPAYEAAASPLKVLCRMVTAPDFRPVQRLKVSDQGPLQKLSEHGEIRHVVRHETGEQWQLSTYASIIALTRAAMINDDLGGLTDATRSAGVAAAMLEADLIWSLFTENSNAGPTLAEDTKALWHADHENLSTDGDGDIDIESVSKGRQFLRTVKGVGPDARPLGLTPKFIVCGPSMETMAEQFLATANLAYHANQDVNPFRGRLEALVESRCADDRYYIFADPARMPCFELAHLASAPGPQMSMREGWNTLGAEWRCVLDVAAAATEWRGAWANLSTLEE